MILLEYFSTFLHKNLYCGNSLELPRQGDSNEYPQHLILWRAVENEPSHDKTNKMACAPSEDPDQPGHPPSLIRVFAVCMKKAWVLRYPLSAQ